MHLVERRFLRGRRLSAWAADGSGAANARGACEGVEDDPASGGAEDRSGTGRGWAVGEIVEAVNTQPSSRRKPGPITTNGRDEESRLPACPFRGPRRMGPGFCRDDNGWSRVRT